ncbi:MAG: hypothetical protein ACOCSK_03265 [Rhodothermales bacterium]
MPTLPHPALTISGQWVYWRGRSVEHINYSAQDDYDWDTLVERCKHIEWLGMEPTSSTVIWHWPWFETMPFASIYRDLLKLTPGFYEHGCTRERAIELQVNNVPPPVEQEPDGSIAVVYRDVAVTWDGMNARRLHYNWDIAEAQGIYHAMKAARYNMAQMGQPVINGPCYATYEQVETWLDNHLVELGGSIAILRALDVGR